MYRRFFNCPVYYHSKLRLPYAIVLRTVDKQQVPITVYQGMYGWKQLFVRPTRMFDDDVTLENGNVVKRFVRCGNKKTETVTVAEHHFVTPTESADDPTMFRNFYNENMNITEIVKKENGFVVDSEMLVGDFEIDFQPVCKV